MTVTTPTPVGTGVLRTLPSLPPGWADAARGRIESWIDAGMPDPALAHLDETARRNHYTYVSYGDESLRSSPLLQRCIDHCTPFVREIVGADTVPGEELQIATRFPGESGGPHLDGMSDPARLEDPVVPNAVLIVYLSDVGPTDGPLGVWPQMLDEVRRYGGRSAADPGYDPGQRVYRELMASAEGLPATPVTGAAGSAHLFHGGLVHGLRTNEAQRIRHALIMRYYRHRHFPLGPKRPTGRRALNVLADPVAAWA